MEAMSQAQFPTIPYTVQDCPLWYYNQSSVCLFSPVGPSFGNHSELYNFSCCIRSQSLVKVRAAEGDPRGLLWVLDEEMATPGSTENTVLERVCQYFGETGEDVSVFW